MRVAIIYNQRAAKLRDKSLTHIGVSGKVEPSDVAGDGGVAERVGQLLHSRSGYPARLQA